MYIKSESLLFRNEVNQLIKTHIKDSGQWDSACHILGFFYLHKPEIVKKLIDYIKQGEVEGFLFIVYEHIEDMLANIRDTIPHDIGPIENPGKQQINRVLESIKNRKTELHKRVAAETLSYLSAPGFPIGLLPVEWIGPVK